MELFGTTALDALVEWTRAGSAQEAVRIARSSLTTVLRLGAGASALPARGPRPDEQLVLYEREACPYSRRVREALAMLDLDVLSRPVPEGSTRHARELERLTGGRTVPALVDRGAGVVVQGSDGIIAHLFARYGDGEVPLRLRLQATSTLASRLGGERGERMRAAVVPAKPLELAGYEGSPATRLVRERLTELEIPYVSRQLAPHSPRRAAYFAREGTMELPHLVDPNHVDASPVEAGSDGDVSLFGADAILAWLDRTYALTEGRARESGEPRSARAARPVRSLQEKTR